MRLLLLLFTLSAAGELAAETACADFPNNYTETSAAELFETMDLAQYDFTEYSIELETMLKPIRECGFPWSVEEISTTPVPYLPIWHFDNISEFESSEAAVNWLETFKRDVLANEQTFDRINAGAIVALYLPLLERHYETGQEPRASDLLLEAVETLEPVMLEERVIFEDPDIFFYRIASNLWKERNKLPLLSELNSDLINLGERTEKYVPLEDYSDWWVLGMNRTY